MVRLLGRWPQLFWVTIAILWVFSLVPRRAEATIGIGVTPTQVTVEAGGGSTASGVIKVSNEGDVPLSIKVYAMERRKDERGLRFLDPGYPRISAARWLRLQPETFPLDPGTAREVRWEVQVPSGAAPGDHVAVAFFEYVPPSPGERGTKMVVGGRVGTIIAIRVPGQVVADPRILSFGFARRTVVWRLPPVLGWNIKPLVVHHPWLPVANNPPVPLELVVQNRGNVQFHPDGEVAFYDLFGRPVGTVRFQGQPIYPNDTSQVEIAWDGAPFMGLFRAHLTLQSGGAGTLQREAWIGVFPWKESLSLAAALIGVTLLRRNWQALRARNIRTAPEQRALEASPAAPATVTTFPSFPPRRLRRGRSARAVKESPPFLGPQLRNVFGETGRIATSVRREVVAEEETLKEKALKEALAEFRGKLLQLIEETDELFRSILSSESNAYAPRHLPGTDQSKGGRRIGDNSGGR